MHDFNSRIIKESKVGKTEGTITYRLLHEISGEMSRNEIAVILGVKPSQLAQPIFSLCEAGLLLKRKDKWIRRKLYYYRLPNTPTENQSLKPFLCPRCLKSELPRVPDVDLCTECAGKQKTSDKESGFGGDLSLEYLRKPITGLKI